MVPLKIILIMKINYVILVIKQGVILHLILYVHCFLIIVKDVKVDISNKILMNNIQSVKTAV